MEQMKIPQADSRTWQLFFDKGAKAIQEEMIVFSTDDTGCPYAK